MAEKIEPFERINYYEGLFLKTEDWSKGQLYQLEKRRFHNKYLHTPGVVFGCLGDLKVKTAKDGTALVIEAGYAIDGDGHDMFLPEAKEINLPPLEGFAPPNVIYVSIRYTEEEADYRPDDANPAYSGHAYIAEGVQVEIGSVEPDNREVIELARVQLSESPTFLKDPEVHLRPEADELDMTHVLAAGGRMAARPSGQLSLRDLGIQVLDTTIQVRPGNKKQEDTNVLIEKVGENEPQPMYMVHAQSMDGARIQWWIECCRQKDDKMVEYTLHLKNYATRSTKVMCKVFSMRV